MSYLILLIVRLIPVAAIFALRQGRMPLWALALTVIVSIAAVVVGAYYANEHDDEIANPLRAKLKQFAPLRLMLNVLYVTLLIVLVVV